MRTVLVPLAQPLFRGSRRLRIALVGLPQAGTSTVLRALGGDDCDVDIGLDQAHVVVTRPDTLPTIAADVVIQVADATDLERHLELTLALQTLGRPLVLALNRMDVARERGMHIGTKVLSRSLQTPVVATVASMGYGIRELFTAAVAQARSPSTPATHPSAAVLAEIARRPGGVHERHDWRYWLDE